jgi:hypothetical protein
MRYSAGGRSTAGSTTLPIGSLYAGAAQNAHIREIGVVNTTTSAVALKLVRLSTTGTQGASISGINHDGVTLSAGCAVRNTHTVAPTVASDLGYNVTLGAAIGSGWVWTFGADTGLIVPVGTSNGLGIIVATGTGQALDFYFVWDE